jgi:hypothetical protein
MILILIVAAWLTLQAPLGMLLGKCIKERMAELLPRQDRANRADPWSSLEIAGYSTRRS